MLRLPTHRRLPGNAEPGEVFIDRSLIFRPAARRVDILDAQQESSAPLACQVEIDQRRTGMAEMEIAVRARRKSENGWRHVSCNTRHGRACRGHDGESKRKNARP